MSTFFQQIVNGLTIGMIYTLIALGYTMVYGIAQLINFAHGDVFMVGAYLGLFAYTTLLPLCAVATHSAAGIALIFLIGMGLSALLGVLIERFAYQPLRSAPRLAPLITAIGVSFLLQNIVMLVFGPTDKSFPELMKIQNLTFGP